MTCCRQHFWQGRRSAIAEKAAPAQVIRRAPELRCGRAADGIALPVREITACRGLRWLTASDAGPWKGSSCTRARRQEASTPAAACAACAGFFCGRGINGSGWSAQATFIHNQRYLGAHAGVQGPDVYNRLVADVRLGDAVRRTVRNDMYRYSFVPVRWARPLEAAAIVTAHRLRFTSPGQDAAEATLYRLVSRLRQSVVAGSHRARLELEAWFQHATRIHLTVRDSVSWGRLGFVGQAGLHSLGGTRLLGGSVQLAYDAGNYAGHSGGFTKRTAAALAGSSRLGRLSGGG